MSTPERNVRKGVAEAVSPTTVARELLDALKTAEGAVQRWEEEVTRVRGELSRMREAASKHMAEVSLAEDERDATFARHTKSDSGDESPRMSVEELDERARAEAALTRAYALHGSATEACISAAKQLDEAERALSAAKKVMTEAMEAYTKQTRTMSVQRSAAEANAELRMGGGGAARGHPHRRASTPRTNPLGNGRSAPWQGAPATACQRMRGPPCGAASTPRGPRSARPSR